MLDASSTLISLRFRQNAFLERLPHELLLVVFNWIRIIAQFEGSRPSLEPLSKTLVPFVRRNLYRNVGIKALDFLEFCDTVERHSLHSQIRSLYVFRPVDPNEYPFLPTAEEPTWQLRKDQIYHFFRLAVNIISLDIDLCYNLSLLILSPKFSSTVLPNLIILVVSHNGTNLLKSLRFRRFYARLERVTINLSSDGEAEEPSWIVMERCELDDRPLPPDRVLELKIHAEEHSYQDFPIISTFPILRSFELENFGNTFHLDTILPQLDPQHLRQLRISSACGPRHMALALALVPFQKLESVALSGQFIGFEVLASLRQLPALHTLQLDFDEQLNYASILSMLEGPRRLVSLKKLLIHEFIACTMDRGRSYLDKGHRFEICPALGLFRPEGWSHPSWLLSFGQTEAKRFLRDAERCGVDTGDSLLSCIEFERDYELELEQCRIYSETAEGLARIEEWRATEMMRRTR